MIKSRISLTELIKRVSKDRNIDLKDLISSKRKKDISNTRAIISYLAAIELKHSGAKNQGRTASCRVEIRRTAT